MCFTPLGCAGQQAEACFTPLGWAELESGDQPRRVLHHGTELGCDLLCCGADNALYPVMVIADFEATRRPGRFVRDVEDDD